MIANAAAPETGTACSKIRTCYGYVCCLRGATDLDMSVGRRVPV